MLFGEVDVFVCDVGDLCEGFVWDECIGMLVWVDIFVGVVNIVDLCMGEWMIYELGVFVGVVVLCAWGGWVAVVERGFVLLDVGWWFEGEVIVVLG